MRTIILFIAILAITVCNPGYTQPVDKDKLDRFFDHLEENNQAMGSLSIMKDGNVIYSRELGYSYIDGDEKKPITPDTRYRIGSITKMFTAVIVFQLVDEGRIKLTDKLDKYFPEIPGAQKITVAHVLAHRSGIHDIFTDRELRPLKTEAITKDALLALIAKGQPDFEPGTEYRYSNSGYIILGLIIEKLTGKTYSEVLRERITSKIGLSDTYVATGNIDPGNNEAFSYRKLGEWRQESETHPALLFSAGSIVSTPDDLARFIHELFGLKLISKENLSLMRTMTDGEGVGMVTFQFSGKTFYGHTGGVDNFGSWLAYLPEEDLAISYATNAKVYPVEDIMKGISDIYFNIPFQIPSFEDIKVPADILEKYAGVYSNPEAPSKMTVTGKNETLHVQAGGQSAVPLKATAQNEFTIDGAKGVVFQFDTLKNQMTITRPNGSVIFTKENNQ